MISGVDMHYAPCWLPTLLSDVNIEGRSEMRQVRKGRKSEREAISRVEKKHYKTVCESRRSFKYHRSYRVLKTSIPSWK